MSVQFGNWDFQRSSSNSLGLGPVREHLAPYGPDGVSLFHDENVDILFCSMRETEDAQGKVINWSRNRRSTDWDSDFGTLGRRRKLTCLR